MAAQRCPVCDGPCYGPFYPDAENKPGGYAGKPVYAAYGGQRAFTSLISGGGDRFYNFGMPKGLYAWIIESDGYRDQPTPILPFFSKERLLRLVPEPIAAQILLSLAALVNAVRAAANSGESCPTCGGPSFVRDGSRYALRGNPDVETAGRALYGVPSGQLYEGQNVPFFSESFLYEAIGKDDARSVLATIHQILRCAGVEDVWRLEYA